MSFKPFTILEPTTAPSPLVIDSPHSGRIYPADFGYTCPLPLLRQTEDFHVDELVRSAVNAGATVILAEFPRSYIDVNRAENDIDPDILAETWPEPLDPSPHTLQGLGLVRRLCRSGIPVYRTPLTNAEIVYRLTWAYRPYHAALKKALDERHALFGECYLLNIHSMPNSEGRQARRPDFVLGDRCGASCDLSLTRRVYKILSDMDYSVAINDPYQGLEIVQRYGQPQNGRHALQLEINRRLYMDEGRLEKHQGFRRLQANLQTLFTSLAAEISAPEISGLAAE